MKRGNRKKNSRGFIVPVPYIVLVFAAAFAALGHIWLGCRQAALGRDLKVLEHEHLQLVEKLCNEAYKWAQMKSPRGMERALKRCGLDMTWPAQTQIVRLSPRDLAPADTPETDRNAYAFRPVWERTP
ncbi:MAG: hypothetical protein JW951_05555 [Lentisphaerae bacterium]|nr:hypothetical protein [Lentisphaerota bacterium]